MGQVTNKARPYNLVPSKRNNFTNRCPLRKLGANLGVPVADLLLFFVSIALLPPRCSLPQRREWDLHARAYSIQGFPYVGAGNNDGHALTSRQH